MRKAIIAVAIMAVSALAIAEYNASKHQNFVERLSNQMHQQQDSREECQRLIDMYIVEGIEAHADFIDHPSGITTAEMTAAIDYCRDFIDFNESVAVPAANRRNAIVPFLGTRVRN